MGFLKVLQGVEEFIYQIVLWMVLLPKTFYNVVTKPAWIHDYTRTELGKQPEKRFSDFTSPILFWVFIAVIPIVALHNYFGPTPENNARIKLVDIFTENNLLEVIVMAALPPLAYSVLMVRSRKIPISRESLRGIFYVQCYCFAPFELLVLPFVVRHSHGMGLGFDHFSDSIFDLSSLFLMTGFLWLIYAEIIILRKEFSLNWLDAIHRHLLYTVGSFLFNIIFLVLWIFIRRLI